MKESFIDIWRSQSTENDKLLAQEEFILSASESIWSALEDKGWTKADLARELGKSKSYVSQLLNGSRNMTLRTFAEIAYVMALHADIRLSTFSNDGNWENSGLIVNTGFCPEISTDYMPANDNWTAPRKIVQRLESCVA